MRGSPYTNLNRPPLRDTALRRSLTGPGQFYTDIQVVPETGSTNVDVVGAARAGAADGYVLVAERQTAGRGRQGRDWTAPARAGLTFSVLLRPGRAVPAVRLGWLPLLAGVALAESVGRVGVVDSALKWPNDLLIRSATASGDAAGYGKCAGILAEVVPDAPGEGSVVVLGIGLNVSQRVEELPPAPDPAAYPPTSLGIVGAVCSDRDPLLRAALRGLADWYRRWRSAGGDPEVSGVRDAYRERCATLGRQVRVILPDGAAITGKASDVDIEGRLVVDIGRGESYRVAAGDVLHVR